MAAVRPAVRPFRPPPSRRPPPSGQQQQHQQYGPTVHAPLPPPPPLQAFSQLSLVMPLVPAAQQKWRQDLQRAVSAEEVAGAVAFAEFSAGETCDGCRARQFKFVDMGQPGAVHLHLLPCLHKFCDACCVVLASTHSVPTCSVCLEAFRIEDVWPSIRNLSQLTILCGKCMHMGFTTQPAHRVCTMCHHFYCTNHARDHIASSLHATTTFTLDPSPVQQSPAPAVPLLPCLECPRPANTKCTVCNTFLCPEHAFNHHSVSMHEAVLLAQEPLPQPLNINVPISRAGVVPCSKCPHDSFAPATTVCETCNQLNQPSFLCVTHANEHADGLVHFPTPVKQSLCGPVTLAPQDALRSQNCAMCSLPGLGPKGSTKGPVASEKYCESCDQYFCTFHGDSHAAQARPQHQHVCITATPNPFSFILCARHSMSEVAAYCTTCKLLVCRHCEKCDANPGVQGHTTDNMPLDAKIALMHELRPSLQELHRSYLPSLDTAVAELDVCARNLELRLAVVQAFVRDVFDDLEDELDLRLSHFSRTQWFGGQQRSFSEGNDDNQAVVFSLRQQLVEIQERRAFVVSNIQLETAAKIKTTDLQREGLLLIRSHVADAIARSDLLFAIVSQQASSRHLERDLAINEIIKLYRLVSSRVRFFENTKPTLAPLCWETLHFVMPQDGPWSVAPKQLGRVIWGGPESDSTYDPDTPPGFVRIQRGMARTGLLARDLSKIGAMRLGSFGRYGSEKGAFKFSLSLTALPDGTLVVCDTNNCRLQCVPPQCFTGLLLNQSLSDLPASAAVATAQLPQAGGGPSGDDTLQQPSTLSALVTVIDLAPSYPRCVTYAELRGEPRIIVAMYGGPAGNGKLRSYALDGTPCFNEVNIACPNPKGVLWVPSSRSVQLLASSNDNTVVAYDDRGRQVWASEGGGLKGARGLALLRGAQEVAVADEKGNCLHVLDINDGRFLRYIGVNQLEGPVRMATVSGGEVVLVSENDASRVSIWTANGNRLHVWGTRGKLAGQFVRPSGIVVYPTGHIAVVDLSLGRIQLF